MKKITQDTKLAEFLEDRSALQVLARFKVPCPNCPFARMEANDLSIGEICRMYEIDSKKLLIELNKLYKT